VWYGLPPSRARPAALLRLPVPQSQRGAPIAGGTTLNPRGAAKVLQPVVRRVGARPARRVGKAPRGSEQYLHATQVFGKGWH